MLGPQMCAIRCIDELRGDAHPIRSPAYASFEEIAHAQFAADLLHVERSTFVGAAVIPVDDEQPSEAAQCRDNVFDNAVGEILLLRIVAHVLEWQNSDRRLIGKGRAGRSIRQAYDPIAPARNGDETTLS